MRSILVQNVIIIMMPKASVQNVIIVYIHVIVYFIYKITIPYMKAQKYGF
jgi:hypothetical protein